MKKILRLAGLLCLLCLLAAIPASGKYVKSYVLNYNLWKSGTAVNPADSVLLSDSDILTGLDANGIDRSNYGFDVVYYTKPIIVTAGEGGGGDEAGSDKHPDANYSKDGSEIILKNCPAGWYAFKLRGGDGGYGRCWSNSDGYIGAGGQGGRGAMVSGWTYFAGGTIIVRAGKIGEKHSNGDVTADWGGGKTHSSAWAGAGGGYSGIFLDTSGGTTCDKTTVVAIAGGGGGGGGGSGDHRTGYNCGGQGGSGGSYNTARNAVGLPTSANPGPWGGRGGGSTDTKEYHVDPAGTGTGSGGGNDGNVGSGGGGGGGGGNRECRETGGHLGSGGSGGSITYNMLTTPYFGFGGAGGGGYADGETGGNGAGEFGGWINTSYHMGDATRGTSMSDGGIGLGGTGGWSNSNKGNGGGGGGGGYAGGGGGGHGSRNSAGGGGGSSYLRAQVWPLVAEAGYPGLPSPWKDLIPADPNTTATRDDRDRIDDGEAGWKYSYNGFAWIMYMGARSPLDTQNGYAEKGITDSGGYIDMNS